MYSIRMDRNRQTVIKKGRTTSTPQKKTRWGQKHKKKPGDQQDHPIEGMDNLVINISSRTLNVAEHSLLQKGLSFCPSYRCRTFDLDMDLQRFFRQIRLKAHFSINPVAVNLVPVDVNSKLLSSSSLGLRNKSHFRPPHGSHAVETFISFVQDSFTSLRESIERGNLFYPPNLTTEERHSLINLQGDKSIIMKPSDKGGALVIMDKTKYMAEIMRQLSDNSIYQALVRNPSHTIHHSIETILHKYTELGVLGQKTCSFLLNPNPIIPVFYTLPKIHKNLENPPGRPIVASTDSILSPIVRYIERILTPLIQKSRSFLLDTGSFLKLISEIDSIPIDALLVTLDVRDLYTSIPHEEGIHSVRHLLEGTDMDTDQISLCIDLLRIILTSNFFLFQDTFYLQKRGTAMGSHAAPPYANAYMVHFEESSFYKNSLFRENIIIWKRYIDDVFCVWRGSEDILHTFLAFLNTSWPGITFTINYDLWSMNFLDTLVIKGLGGQLSTDLYSKSTDRNSLLHFKSLHPPSIKRSIPKAQYQRVQRIVSDINTRDQRIQEMTQKFQTRGYPLSILEKSRAVTDRPRADTTSRIPFVHSFHPFMYKLHRAIRSNWPILSNAFPNVTEFQQPFLPCFKRAPSLRDSLVKADIGTSTTVRQSFLGKPREGTFPCLHCVQCNNVLKGNAVTHPYSVTPLSWNAYFTAVDRTAMHFRSDDTL
ncbi:unnamed protein product [Ranitomeya imitator]|uniref:Reverse transcriptase domain-containing protein n=1 Tax=Ranitomeya imitator TaxID=111125 RepID=A0ABN9LW48_9NEOB|nr:unnamed protein product [Ranitomeya imitator]